MSYIKTKLCQLEPIFISEIQTTFWWYKFGLVSKRISYMSLIVIDISVSNYDI